MAANKAALYAQFGHGVQTPRRVMSARVQGGFRQIINAVKSPVSKGSQYSHAMSSLRILKVEIESRLRLS